LSHSADKPFNKRGEYEIWVNSAWEDRAQDLNEDDQHVRLTGRRSFCTTDQFFYRRGEIGHRVRLIRGNRQWDRAT
jgi:hypothetical protein